MSTDKLYQLRPHIHPSVLMLASMVLAYFVLILPWAMLTVRPILNPKPVTSLLATPSPEPTNHAQANPDIGNLTQIAARFWETQPLLFTGEIVPGFSPTCSIPSVEWQSQSVSQSFTWFQRAGWLASFIELGLWLTSMVAHRKAKPVISYVEFAIIAVGACISGVILLALIGPSASCPQLMGVRVERVFPAWVTVFLSLASIGLGILGVAIRPVSHFSTMQPENRAG